MDGTAGNPLFQMVAGIELDNPVSANVNGGNIEVVSNWNLGATDANGTPVFRSNGIAPNITFRAGRDVAIDASISDGFVQAAALVSPLLNGGVPVGTNGYGAQRLSIRSHGLQSREYRLSAILQSIRATFLIAAPATFGALGLSGPGVGNSYYGSYESYLAAYANFFSAAVVPNSGDFSSSGVTASGAVNLFLSRATTAYAVASTDITQYGAYLTAYARYLSFYTANYVPQNVPFGNLLATLPTPPLPPPAQPLGAPILPVNTPKSGHRAG